METEAMEPATLEADRRECRNQERKERNHKGLWWKMLLGVIGFLLVTAVVAAVTVWNANVFSLDLTLNGEQEIILEYDQSFDDPGATAQFSGSLLLRKPEAITVTADGTVDVSVLGTYQLTYTAQRIVDYYIGKLSFTEQAVRTVRVVDTQVPVIKLTKNQDSYTIPGQPYTEEGFTAVDNYDGDLTAHVVCREEDGKVYYTVTDSSGNTAEEIRQIVYYDPVAPELILEGKTDVSITQGNSYKEPGYTATDNCDGDITDRVIVRGSVDINTPGSYTLEYTVSDSYNNTTKVTRVVRVNEPLPMPELPPADPQSPVTPNGKVIYLTFDDGPSAHTERLLNILDKYGVKATFFVVKTGYLHLLPRMAASGHSVGIHSATHNYSKIYASDNAYFNDLYDMQSTIASYTGQSPTILRFPGGSSNTASCISPGIMTRLTATLKEMGYRYFDWNVDSRDVSSATSAESVYWNVVNGCSRRNISIVLQHDIKGFSVDAVEMIIQWGLANGYTFLPLDASSPVCEHSLNN